MERERGRIAKTELEEGEGYLYPLPNVVVAVLGVDYAAKKGADYPPPQIIWPEMGRIIRLPPDNPALQQKIRPKNPPLHLIDVTPGP
jgi:hypothetical protein